MSLIILILLYWSWTEYIFKHRQHQNKTVTKPLCIFRLHVVSFVHHIVNYISLKPYQKFTFIGASQTKRKTYFKTKYHVIFSFYGISVLLCYYDDSSIVLQGSRIHNRFHCPERLNAKWTTIQIPCTQI